MAKKATDAKRDEVLKTIAETGSIPTGYSVNHYAPNVVVEIDAKDELVAIEDVHWNRKSEKPAGAASS